MTAFDDIKPQRRPLLFAGAGITAVLLLGAGAWWFTSGDQTPPPRRIIPPVVVQLVLPPPPPPPPPPPEKQPEPEMQEQPKMVEPELKEEPIVDKPPEAAEHDDAPPPGPLALDAKAEGPGDAMGLGSNPGGRGLLSGAGRSRWGWYAGMVQSQIEAALRNNAKLRNALVQVQLRLWADNSGRINKVQIVSSNGTPELNAILQNDLLPGLQLREAPPGDMPMPMVTRITVRRTS